MPHHALTREYDGTTWRKMPTTSLPPFRGFSATAYDHHRRLVVLFGSRPSRVPLSDTWVYDGTRWTEVATASTPPARSEAALADDPRIERLVVFGGIGQGSQARADTWEFDGADWVETTPYPSPSARATRATAHDATLRDVVVVGSCPSSIYGSSCTDSTGLFRRDSGWPDEQCADETDNDSDGDIDCADPSREGLRCAKGRCEHGSCR